MWESTVRLYPWVERDSASRPVMSHVKWVLDPAPPPIILIGYLQELQQCGCADGDRDVMHTGKLERLVPSLWARPDFSSTPALSVSDCHKSAWPPATTKWLDTEFHLRANQYKPATQGHQATQRPPGSSRVSWVS